nr:unnamed protein product [Callosobruchus analis]
MKKNSIRILGLQEKENKDSISVVIDFLTVLGISCSKLDIDMAFRINRTNNDNSPKVMLVNFTTNHKKTDVLGVKRTKLKDLNVAIYEDLTHENYQLLKKAKKKLGGRNVWSVAGKIYVKCGDEKQQIRSEVGLLRF